MVKNGIDCIDQYDHVFRGKRLGLITSISGVNQKLQSTVDILSDKYNLTALFSPEHGVRGNIGAGDIVENDIDPYTGIPVLSLYRRESKRLTKEMLEMADAIVYDIQDIGTRYFTFISTLYYAMQGCEKNQKEFIVFDRQNPLGGKVEGNIQNEQFESFIGAYPLCMRYGMTIGELADMIYDEQNYHFPLTIISVEGWKRDMMFPDTDNIWVMPSPGIPRFNTALLYPGTCLFEGTNLSEGRGTAAPFEIIGAPYVDGYKFARYMNQKKLPGVMFSPAYFVPSTSKYQGEECQGIHIHVTEFERYESVKTGIVLLDAFRNCYSKDFGFLKPLEEGGKRSIELLFGNAMITNETVSLGELLETMEQDTDTFIKRKEKYQRY